MLWKKTGAGDSGGWGQYLSLGAVGIEMGAALAVGLALGWYLDRLLDTRPWLMVVFTGFGIVAGFRNLIRVGQKQARAIEEMEEREDEQKRP